MFHVEHQLFEVQMLVWPSLKLTYHVQALDADAAQQKAFAIAIREGYTPFSGASVANPLPPFGAPVGEFFA
jgi:hypothetical protein